MGGEDRRPPASWYLGPSRVPLLYRNGTLPLGVPHWVGYPIKLHAGHRCFLLFGLGRMAYRPPRHTPPIHQVAQRVPSHLLLPNSYPKHMVHVPAHGPGPIGQEPLCRGTRPMGNLRWVTSLVYELGHGPDGPGPPAG